MESKFKRGLHICCGIVLALFLFGCSGIPSATDWDRLDKRVSNLETILGAEVGTSAYTAHGFYGGGSGDCDAITGTADGDRCLVFLHDDANLGDAVIAYVLDADSSCGGDDSSNVPPLYFETQEEDARCWELASWSTPPVVVSDPDTWTMSGPRMYGGTWIAVPDGSNGDDATTPSAKPNMHFCVKVEAAQVVTLTPYTNEYYYLDGAVESQNETIVSSGAVGDMVCCEYRASGYFDCMSDGWDGGTD